SRGHAFVDVWGSGTGLLEVEAESHTAHAQMGDVLQAESGDKIRFTVHVAGVPPEATLALAGSGAKLVAGADQHPRRVGPNGADAQFTFTADGQAHWIRVDVRGPQGKLLLIGNPIYLRPAANN